MRFLFRTDADMTIGTGHLIRCLALAEALRANGAECIFLCRAAGLGNLVDNITAAGHRLLSLPQSAAPADVNGPPHAAWLPGGQAKDASACLQLLAGQMVDWLIVDHYALDHRWQSMMRPSTSRIMVIDDLADRQHDCDLLLDQNLIPNMEERYDSLVPSHCIRLLGPRYALLREEFARAREASARPITELPNLLVMFGGADPQNLTLRSVDQLAAISWQGYVDVVAGPLYSQLDRLKEAVSSLAHCRLHAPANNVAALMQNADLALGSPGVASWERCACALPAITIAQAENQEDIGRKLGETGAHFYLGRAESITDDALSAALSTWLTNPWARKAMSHKAATVCDGKGLRRVIAKLAPPRLSIQRALLRDAEMLFAWRNDERIRRHALDPRPLILAEHMVWIEQMLSREDVDLLLAYHGETPIVCIRFDCIGSRARVSIYVDPDMQGSGFGRTALLEALEWLRCNRPEITDTDADVLPGNFASHAVFSAAGYRLAWSRYERVQEGTDAC